ncbi:Lrp/AsnC family transcriptional regulator [Streptomyces hygroscopicus]|uniref:Lrp/AsnC family transcriptional regulator n=1 Tax=Streptomyces hygroscopicus TaxID=1912 RepID=UPI00224042C9|nr:Lrp/AsnC family transcriptional regulator [Streptomyces hygroscopicus]
MRADGLARPGGGPERGADTATAAAHGRIGAHPPATDADAALLEALGRDGRASHAELAQVTGWSPATVARRLTGLQAAGALFFDVDLNDTLLGATAQALL